MKNPYLNAIAAGAYIVGVVQVLNLFVDKNDAAYPLLIPMTMISLFTLSAAVMAYLFAFEPVRLFVEGHKAEGVTFFLKTVATFAVITAAFAITLTLMLA